MNKQQFLLETKRKLRELPPAELARSLAYFSELIDDSMEEGLSEAEAVAALGSPEEAAASILREQPRPAPLPEKKRGRLRFWEILLLLLGLPLWLPLLLAAAATVFSILVAIWCLIPVCCALALALVLGGICGFAACLIRLGAGSVLQGLLLLGAGLLCVGLGILAFLLLRGLCRLIIDFSKWLLHKLGSLFHRKEH